MKATGRDFAATAPRAAAQARIFYFCGQDESGAFDAAERIVSLLREPGERIELSGQDLRRDPVRLGDEARSNSLFGGSRHILVRAQGDEAHDAVANLIDDAVEACPVLIVATSATDKSRTAKLLVGRPDALVVNFYAPDLSTVTGAVRNLADGAGLRIDAAIAQRIARAAGLDTRLAASEIEKLALYLDASPDRPRSVDQRDLDAIGAATEDDGVAPLVDAVLGGKSQVIAAELRRMREVGLNPVAVLLAFERRAAQLAALAARLEPGSDLRTVLKGEAAARRIFWKEQDALAAQLGRWRGPRLARLVDRLVALHQALLANSQDSELLLAQGLTRIAAALPKRA